MVGFPEALLELNETFHRSPLKIGVGGERGRENRERLSSFLPPPSISFLFLSGGGGGGSDLSSPSFFLFPLLLPLSVFLQCLPRGMEMVGGKKKKKMGGSQAEEGEEKAVRGGFWVVEEEEEGC